MEVSKTCDQQRSILIVDDNEETLVLASRYLDEPECQLEIAHDGIEALEFAVSRSFDSVVVDIQMPNVDGWRVAALLRDQGFEGRLIACSAHALDNDEFWTVPNCFDDYIKKPFTRSELMARVLL